MRDIRQLIGSSAFSDLDRHFAAFAERQSGGDRPALALAAALVSRWRREGHSCLDLSEIAGTMFPDPPIEGVTLIPLPDLKGWVSELKKAPVVGEAEGVAPLVLDERHRLYLRRYWEYERSLASRILDRAGAKPEELNETTLGKKLQALLPSEPPGALNWQCVAAVAALRRNFCVISGGPGTGKTHTLVLILALLLELEKDCKLRIAVAAPTGKAAARIQDSIRAAKASLACSEAIKAQLPEHAVTIHRLLGYIPDSAYFQHNAEHPLPYDVVAVDEASMVDLALMAKLFQAIPPSARVILLGDKDQLASVEAGAVLGDICSAGGRDTFSDAFSRDFNKLTGQALPAGDASRERPPVAAGRMPAATSPSGPPNASLADCVVHLRKNYRFGEQSAIYRLSNAINDGRAEDALQILHDSANHRGSDLAAPALPRCAELKEALRKPVTDGFREFIRASNPLPALTALTRFRILCALREGPFGVAGLNQMVEDILEEAGLIRLLGAWYAHRPIMITRNDYNLKLFNGDIGVVLPDPESGEPRAFFPGPDNEVRKFLPLRLPEHQTAYALTVHKSQGSEFDRVLFVLPDRENPVLSRELLYTAITRARKSVELWVQEPVFRAALARRVSRTSGLRDVLSGA